MEKVLESFLTLVARLQVVSGNSDACMALRVKYRPIAMSTSTKDKAKAGSEIASILKPIYDANREKVMDKDFSFLLQGEGMEGIFMVQGKDLGQAYASVVANGSDEELKKVTAGLLHLFFLVSPEEDQKVMEERHAKKDEVSKKNPNFASLGPGRPNVGMAHKMEKLLEKNKDKLKRAENDPTAISGVLGDFFHENSRDMANMLTNILGDTGVLTGDSSSSSH